MNKPAPPSEPPQGISETSAQRRSSRRLNITLIKSLIVFCVGLATAIGSALTGIAAQVPFAPMLTWMLGFASDKAMGTALRYALGVSAAALVTTFVQGGRQEQFLLRGLLLFVGATIGAMLAAPLSPKPDRLSRRQFLQTLGVGISLFVIARATSINDLNPNAHFVFWNALWQIGLIGLVAGILTQASGLVSGVVLVPALYFFCGFSAHHAIVLSLLVSLMASLLPAWGYSQKGLADTNYGLTASIGGVMGGVIGALLLLRLSEKWALYLFAVLAMFLCAREVSRIVRNSPSVPK